MRYVLSPRIIGTDDANKCKEACQYDAIDLEMEARSVTLKVGAVVWATGWEPYDAARIDNLGFGQYDNIVTNMMMERMAATKGPTGARSSAPRMTVNRRVSPLSSAPAPVTKTTCPIVPTSAAWPH
jgi:quinone-modifying oxidoreductase subunit QmoA